MIIKIEMNEQGEVDFDFKGTNNQAIRGLVTVMDASGDFAELIKLAIDGYEKIQK